MATKTLPFEHPDFKEVEVLQKKLRAINHDLRRSILSLIHKNEMICVTKIFTTLRIPQPIASQHLRILRNANMVTAIRSGKTINYVINYKQFEWLKVNINIIVSNKIQG